MTTEGLLSTAEKGLLITAEQVFEAIDPLALTILKELGSHPQVNNTVMAYHPVTGDRVKFMAELEKTFKKDQLHTEEQRALFCRGTTHLLELLENYTIFRTKKAVFMAVADVKEVGTTPTNFRSYLTRDNLNKHYGDIRRIKIHVLTSVGAVGYTFEEKVITRK